MAKDTQFRLESAALELFSHRWYETVSIAEICRHASLSNGVFYRYFRSKEEIFRSILDSFLVKFRIDLGNVKGANIDERLYSFIKIVKDACLEYGPEVTVFREGQYRLPEYEEKLRQLYIDTVSGVYNRDITEAEYLYILSGLRFLSTRAAFDGLDVGTELIHRMIKRGVFPAETFRSSFSSKQVFPVIEGSDARTRLLQSGIDLFGTKGFTLVNVHEISSRAGLSVGAFYLYFESKELFLSEIVRLIGTTTRHYLSECINPDENRLEQEVSGIWNFIRFFSHHPEFYEIVREAEFVSKPWVKDYYNRFIAGYLENLEAIPSDERTVTANFLVGLSHYVGIEAIFSNRIEDLPGLILSLGKFLGKGIPE